MNTLIYVLLFIPAAVAVLTLLARRAVVRRTMLIAAAACHTAAAMLAWHTNPGPLLNGWMMLDEPGLLFLTITSVLFLACSVYAFGYLARESGSEKQDNEEGFLFTNAPEAVFCTCLLAFLTTMTIVTVSQHLGLLWVAMEATTLVSAPLIYFHRHHRSLEAAWKYLLICSVGIALALLGNFFIVIAAAGFPSDDKTMVLSALLRQADHFNLPWLKAAFLLCLVGYGTKMGLAPLHTWLPDAHSEAPSVISALLSGALLNCAFLGILRSYQVCMAAGLTPFCQELLVLFGLLSMGWAAVFIMGQPDYKRMLAYSSVEHVGIMALGVGLGAGAVFGSMLHAVNHSLAKAMLFMAAGNVLAFYKTKTTARVSGVLTSIPMTGVLWLAGFLAITGVPPFGLFLSEFTIVKAMIEQGKIALGAVFLGILALIFIGMASAFVHMAQGEKNKELCADRGPEPALAILPPMALGAAALMLGLYVPSTLDRLLNAAAVLLGGN